MSKSQSYRNHPNNPAAQPFKGGFKKLEVEGKPGLFINLQVGQSLKKR